MASQLHPFLLNEKPIRGRVVRLHEVVDLIISRHAYPERISQLLAETLVMAAILSSNLKADGVFTVQVQSKGALSLLVVDATAGGGLRGYAQFDEEADLSKPLPELCAEGYLAITLDPGDGGQRYQGVVPLEGKSIAESIQHYFTQSQQLEVQCKLAVREEDGRWQAAGMYLERMPEAGEESDEAWREARLLLQTVKDEELLDVKLPVEQLLYRLFHEDGVWVYDPRDLSVECRCTREKIEGVLKQMPQNDLSEMAINGSITVDCQFCRKAEIFALSELSVAGEAGQA